MDRMDEARAEPERIPPRCALLPIKEVIALTSLGQTEIYERMAEGTFPRACKLGGRRVAWPADEVLDWCAARRQDRVVTGKAAAR